MNKKKILIIDDEFAVRYLIERHMSRHGFEMLMARDGQTGLEMAHEQKPDLIVLDVQLPDINGFDLCQIFQKEPALAKIPVLIFTSRITSEDKYRAFTVGADDFISKPFLPDEFVAHVSAILQKSPKTQMLSHNNPTKRGKLTAFYGPKGGVGTTTLAVQLSEAIAIHEEEKVALIDLALPLGGIAPMLSLYTQENIVRLLLHPAKRLDMLLVNQFAQQHRTNLIVMTAPGMFIESPQHPEANRLCHLYSLLIEDGYHIIVDVGSRVSPLALATLRKADNIFVVSSGQSVANRMTNAFLDSAQTFRLQPSRLLPVLNEVHGSSSHVELCRLPVARIAHTSERSRTRLWLKENGVHKMMSIALKPM